MALQQQSVFQTDVLKQIELLNGGNPLGALDRFFAADGAMYANNALFASSASEARKKQEPHIVAASSISGRITDLEINHDHEVCVFRNRSTFLDQKGVTHQIDGLCWQKWRDGKIVEERYYDGELMAVLISEGILRQPERLLDRFE